MVDFRKTAALAAAVSVLIGSAASAQQAAQPDPSERVAMALRDKAREGTSAYGLVRDITTRFGPRLAGTPAEHRAADWVAQRFQEMKLENVRVEQFPLTVWTRGVERAEVLGPHAQPLTVVGLGGTIPTGPQGVEGEVVLFETLQDLRDAAPGSLAGKIAVVLTETPRTQTGAGYGSTSAARSQGPTVAGEKGAVGFLLRSLGTHDHRFAHTGATRMGPGVIPGFAMSPPDAEQLRRLVGLKERGGVRVRLMSTPGTLTQGRSQNVVGEVRGRERPDEVIVIGGHLDSWDLGTGAVDDAAGVAITAAALDLIRQQPRRPKRTIRVVAWGSEEVSQPAPAQGLAGARFYADSRKAQLGQHVIASESDFGAGPIYSFSLPAGWAATPFARRAANVLAPIGILFDSAPSTGGGPDTGPLVQGGVPTFRLAQDGSDYFDVHHTADDVLDRIDPKNLDQNVAAWAALLWMIAESDLDFRTPPPAPASTPTPARTSSRNTSSPARATSAPAPSTASACRRAGPTPRSPAAPPT